MCGVSGTFAPDGRFDRGIAAAMHTRLVHRGPDETYSLNTPSLAVKLGRLGMTGLRDGWQPVEDASGRFLAMTAGEIYNADALKARLGTDRANGADVAVVPDLVAAHGPAGLSLIDGQFATVVLDRAENVMYLARDRFGICPLYYTKAGSSVHFCSELKPLVQCVSRNWRVDLGAVDQYLSLGDIVAPRTLVQDVHAVPPGCAVRFSADGVETLRYWRYGDFAVEPVPAGELRSALRQSIDDRLRADVEIGAHLSGGFASTAIVLEVAALVDRPMRTFSVVFDDPALNESRFQREIAAAAQTKHTQIRCSVSDITALFEEMVRHCCAPQRETYNVAAMMLAEEVRLEGIKGVVSGEGADELFFGYDSYVFDSAARGNPVLRAENEQAWGRADFGWEVNWDKAAARRAACLTAETRESLRGQEFWRTRLIPFTDDEVRSLTPMQLRSIADVYVQLSGHLLGDHGDAMMTRHSVEGRYPFLGNGVVEAALRIPDDEKVADFEGKAVLKAAYHGIVPDLVARRGKHGFTAYDLDSVVDPRAWDRWRELVAVSGILAPDCLAVQSGVDRFDFRLSAISIAIVMDELGLR